MGLGRVELPISRLSAKYDGEERAAPTTHRVVEGRKRAVPTNSWEAEARAFVALDTGEVRVYKGYFSYHSTEAKILQNELHLSKPSGASAAERMAGG